MGQHSHRLPDAMFLVYKPPMPTQRTYPAARKELQPANAGFITCHAMACDVHRVLVSTCLSKLSMCRHQAHASLTLVGSQNATSELQHTLLARCPAACEQLGANSDLHLDCSWHQHFPACCQGPTTTLHKVHGNDTSKQQ